MKIKASIIGASGYTGIELIRLLSGHPNVALMYLVSESYNEQEVIQVYPHLANLLTHSFSLLEIEKIAQNSNVVFLALPHTKSAIIAKQLLLYDCKVIDLSADLRLNDATLYTQWYEHAAADSELLKQAVYGLPEIGLRNEIASTRLVANPGCYPTAVILGLAPLLKHGWLDLANSPIIIDAKSGVSGAGRNLSVTTHFCEAMNNFSAYQVGRLHRHIPEIEQELGKLAKQSLIIQFTPYLVPTPRGILITAYGRLNNQRSLSQIEALYQNYYDQCFFIRASASQLRPGIKSVIGSNFCNISLHLDLRTNYLVVVSAIDNLIKGASGQAVQNMNLMYCLPEWTGLQAAPVYP
jgi:N-acetyl-gamma-glutamyl-phosphate reductase